MNIDGYINKNKGLEICFFGIIIPFLFNFFILSALLIITNKFFEFDVNNREMLFEYQIAVNIICFIFYILLYNFKLKNYFNLKPVISINNMDRKILKYILVISFSFALFFDILFYLLNPYLKDSITANNIDTIMNLNKYIAILSVVIFSPINEEILYRMFLFKSIRTITYDKKLSFIFSAIISSTIFAVFHFGISQIIYAFFASLLFCFILEKYNNIVLTIIMHIIMNLSSFFINNEISNITNNKMLLFMLVVFILIFCFSFKLLLDFKSEEK